MKKMLRENIKKNEQKIKQKITNKNNNIIYTYKRLNSFALRSSMHM